MADEVGSTASRTLKPPSRFGARRYNVERSCIRCHQRKTRCDRATPCSACVKTDNADSCQYPSLERAKRRPRKQHDTMLVQKVERLEQIVSENLKQSAHNDRDDRIPQRSSSSPEHKSSNEDSSRGFANFTGLLIKDGNLVRYVNDHVLSHILEKEEEIRSAMTSPHGYHGKNTTSSTARPLTLLHPITQAFNAQDLEGLLPSRRYAIQLWQAFVLNVDPIIKLLHIPTMQPIIYKAIHEPQHVTSDLRALLFAIYFSALVSTLRDGPKAPSEHYHHQELEQFKYGVEVSLSQGDFLDQPTMYSLQAMTIFIGAFRSLGSGRSIWTINGTVIRVAQLMGIHRDGKLFDLTPFEREMRRRLWWRIITFDSRTLEDQGVWVTGNRYLGDARIPLNIDDRDIDPNTLIMPSEQTGFTEATPLISICHIQVAGEAAGQLSLCADLESYTKKLPAAQEAIARARSELEKKFFCNHNPHIPIQRLFRNGTRMILDKIEWRCQEGLLRHQQQSDFSGSQTQDKVYAESDELFTRACELLNVSLELICNEMYTSFMWHSSSYLPYELLTFVLWRLYVIPNDGSADRAWETVLETFSTIAENSMLPDKGPRWTVLCKLKEKVAGLRERPRTKLDTVESSNRSPQMTGLAGDIRGQNNGGDSSLNDTTWDPQDLLFSTDWATFQQNLNMDEMIWP